MKKLTGDPGIQTRVDLRGRQLLIAVAGKITIDSSPAVADGVVFVGSHDHRLYALAAETGEQ